MWLISIGSGTESGVGSVATLAVFLATSTPNQSGLTIEGASREASTCANFVAFSESVNSIPCFTKKEGLFTR